VQKQSSTVENVQNLHLQYLGGSVSKKKEIKMGFYYSKYVALFFFSIMLLIET
jgi:hypothetical protein